MNSVLLNTIDIISRHELLRNLEFSPPLEESRAISDSSHHSVRSKSLSKVTGPFRTLVDKRLTRYRLHGPRAVATPVWMSSTICLLFLLFSDFLAPPQQILGQLQTYVLSITRHERSTRHSTSVRPGTRRDRSPPHAGAGEARPQDVLVPHGTTEPWRGRRRGKSPDHRRCLSHDMSRRCGVHQSKQAV